jgi:hypothetical protein
LYSFSAPRRVYKERNKEAKNLGKRVKEERKGKRRKKNYKAEGLYVRGLNLVGGSKEEKSGFFLFPLVAALSPSSSPAPSPPSYAHTVPSTRSKGTVPFGGY